MQSVIEVLYLRRPRLEYISPPVCEFDFSSTGGPIISLEALGRLVAPSGFVLGGKGKFRLSWNNYPGALCYTVYLANDPNNPFGEYTIVAECIEEPTIDLTDTGGGCARVSAITEHGETELSEPICGIGDCPFITSGATPSSQTVDPGQTINISCEIANPEMVDSYIWYKDGAPFSDTTATTQEILTISNANEGHEGDYSLVITGNGCTDISAPAEVIVTGGGPPCSESIQIVGISTLNDLSPSGIVIGTQASRPWYHTGGVSKDIRTEVNSSPITASQSGTTITASANFFAAADVGKVVVFSTSEQAQITAFVSPLQVTVTPSQSVVATTFVLRGNTLGGPFGSGLLANSGGILVGTEDNFSSVNSVFWLNTNTNQIRNLGTSTSVAPVELISSGHLLITALGVPNRAKLYDPSNQTFTDYGTPPGGTGATQVTAGDLNEHFVMVGTSDLLDNGDFHACRGPIGGLIDIHPAAAGTQDSFGEFINDSGHAVGRYTDPVTFENQVFVNLGATSISIGDLGGEISASGINNSGTIIGNVEVGANFVPYFWTSGGGIQLIPLLPGKTEGVAQSINSAGWIVGQMSPGDTAFIYRNGVTTALIDEVPPGFGWTALTDANHINDAGQIAGRGTNSGIKRYLLQLCS